MRYLFPLLLLLLLTGCAREEAVQLPPRAEAVSAIYPLGEHAAAVGERAEGLTVCVLQDDLTPSQDVLCEGVFLGDAQITACEGFLWVTDTRQGMGWRIYKDLSVEHLALPPNYAVGVWQADTLYYATGNAVRAMEQGTVRLVKQMPCEEAALFALSETELIVSVRTEKGYESTVISAQNGVTKDFFLGLLRDGAGDAAIFRDGAGENVYIRDEAGGSLLAGGERVAALSSDGARALIKSGNELFLLDVQEARILCSMEAEGELRGAVLLENGALLLQEAQTAPQWKPFDGWKRRDTFADVLAFATHQNPRQEARLSLQKRAQKLQELFGVPIFTEGISNYNPEMQPLKLKLALDGLEAVLPYFPEALLRDVGGVCIVSANETQGADGGSFLLRSAGQDIIAVVAGTGQEGYALLHGFGHLMNGAVMVACASFDNWQTCNPTNFGYGLDGNGARAEYAGFFPSEKAMLSPVEDRAELFAYACLPGQSELFRTEAMQNKLLRLCTGIRTAYGLQKDARIFRWEQNLYKTLAPPG